MKKVKYLLAVAAAIVVTTAPALSQLKLNGAGATFPYVI